MNTQASDSNIRATQLQLCCCLMYSSVVIKALSLHRTSEADLSHWLWKQEPQGPNPSSAEGWDGGCFASPPRETDVKVAAGTPRARPIIAGLLRGGHRNRAAAIPTSTWFTHDWVVINEWFWRIHMRALGAPAQLNHSDCLSCCISNPPVWPAIIVLAALQQQTHLSPLAHGTESLPFNFWHVREFD